MHKNVVYIFQSTLNTLLEKKYISEQNFKDVSDGLQKFLVFEQERQDIEKEQREKEREEKAHKEVVVKKEKKVYSPEQLRERNLGVLLYLGVFLLLIGGLFVATSNWDSMHAWMKATAIFFVSILFFGFAFLSRILIKIEKTAFAFFVLGSLFLPIGFLSVSYFQLAGTYLSIQGEGKYVLGVLAGLILFPIYFLLSIYLRSSMFKVITVLTLTGTFGFFIACFHPSVDIFFLAMILYHFINIFILLKVTYKWVVYFQREWLYIFQAQLIFLTLFMLFLYENVLLNGFQYVLIAGLFFMSLMLSKRKNDHFFITISLVIGIYRIFTTPILIDLLPIAFAGLGIFLLSFVFLLKEKLEWGKIWEVTSLVIALSTILYSFIFYFDSFTKGNIYLAIAYCLLSVQFIFISKRIVFPIINYLPPVFFSLALWNIALCLRIVQDMHQFLLVVYSIHLLLLLGLGIVTSKLSFLQAIRKPSILYHLVWMLMITFLAVLFYLGKWYIPIFIMGITYVLLQIRKLIKRKTYQDLLAIAIPLSVACIYFTLAETITFIHEQGIPLSIALASLASLLTANFYKKVKVRTKKTTYYIGQCMYMFAIVLTIQYEMLIWVKTSIYLISIFVFLDFYRRKKEPLLAWLVGSVCGISYLSLIAAIWDNGDYFFTFFMKYGWIMLFFVAIVLRKTVFKYPFLTLSHIYYVVSIALNWFIFGDDTYISFLYGTFAYLLSIGIVLNKYWKRFFHYASYLSLFFFLGNWISFDFIGGDSFALAFFIVSILMFGLYLLVTRIKQEIVYFFLPFSMVGICYWYFSAPFTIYTYLLIIGYIIMSLYVVYLSKLYIFTAIGVFLIIVNNEVFMISANLMSFDRYLLNGLWGILFLFLSSVAYSSVYSRMKEKGVDFYLIGSILSFVFLYFCETTFKWDTILAGLFLSMVFFVQRSRVETTYKWIPNLVSLVILLQPYYDLLGMIAISSLIEVESYVLPWVILVILSKKITGKFNKLFKILEWFIIISVAIILAIDGWLSHTIQDAILLGSLAVISIVLGFYCRYKSYFFTGIGVLVLNVMLQTRPLWGNFPWWVYLLIAGAIMILIASMYEMQKQGKRLNILVKLMEYWKKMMNEWKKWS
ncbi:MAG TPA: hypothetical protein VNR61_02570 [Niallia sp.]|nr:hypothetical protein [Niallia sp.]